MAYFTDAWYTRYTYGIDLLTQRDLNKMLDYL